MSSNQSDSSAKPENEEYGKVSLGRPAVFYIPSVKLNDPNKNLADELHGFLLREFGGYTAERGNIFGYWIEGSHTDYTEHMRYTVSFKGKERIPILERFLSRLAKKLGEEAIYLETGEDSWLIYPK